MFGLFERKYDNPALVQKIRETQERWFIFLDKLEARMDEMTAAAVPELQAVFNQDDDLYKRAHGHMLLGLQGQINQMRDKANEVRDSNIINFVRSEAAELPLITVSAGFKYHTMLHDFQRACLDRYHIFDNKLNEHLTVLKGAAGKQDLEAIYQEQLALFEITRDKFMCKQCGGNITISKMFFIATYVNCPFCQTQNTFRPSTGAQLILHQARDLAELRTAHLLRAYEQSNKDHNLYQQYLRAMFNEWNNIVPDMATENEKFYQRLLKDHLTNNHY
jgi:hypothetical protein